MERGQGGEEADFAITGNVTEEQGWAEDEIKALETMDVESTNSKGETETYTGVSLSELLELADPTMTRPPLSSSPMTAIPRAYAGRGSGLRGVHSLLPQSGWLQQRDA